MKHSILVHGTIAIDDIITPSQSVTGILGGSAPYAAVAARLFNEHVDLVGIVGNDFPEEFTHKLEQAGISLDAVERADGETFGWGGEYSNNMNDRTTLYTKLGVLENWKLELTDQYSKHEIIICANATPSQQHELLDQCNSSRFILMDSMNLWINVQHTELMSMLKRVDLLLLNDSEARELTGKDNIIVAAEDLLTFGPRYVIVKQGEYGSMLLRRREDGSTQIFRCPAWPLQNLTDPTGAGDTFIGALGGYISTLESPRPSWKDLKQGIVRATVLAAITCETFSADALLQVTTDILHSKLEKFREICAWE